nr:YcxB family protein [Duganella guangzhouensis]
MRARQWRQLQASDQHQITGNISEQGLEWNTPMTSTRLPWQKIIKVRQHPDMLLLFYSANCALYLPKSFFASEQAWNEAKQAIILFSRGPS